MMKDIRILFLLLLSLLGLNSAKAQPGSGQQKDVYHRELVNIGAESTARVLGKQAYVFTITEATRVVELILIFDDLTERASVDAVVCVRDPKKNGGPPLRIGSMIVSRATIARFFYVLDYTDIIGLGHRVYHDPQKLGIAGQPVFYRMLARRGERVNVVEREAGDSLPVDQMFAFLKANFLKILDSPNH
jgi:hypothetical protein